MRLLSVAYLVLLLLSGISSAEPPELVMLESIDRDEYILGPGDILSVVVEGGCSEIMLSSGVIPQSFCIVSGDGYISISGIGAVKAGQLSITETQYNVQEKAEEYYPSVTLTISLYSLRTISIGIRGLVEEPGVYNLSATERVSAIVTAAGGISAYGSRTGHIYFSNGEYSLFDLHCDIQTGAYISDPLLTEAVTVVVDECVNPIYVIQTGFAQRSTENEISNIVHSIETWDSETQFSIADFINRMGGVAGNVNMMNSGLVRNGEYLPIWQDSSGFSDCLVLPGDTIVFVSYRDSVFVGGAVENPMHITYHPEMSVHEYVIAAGGCTSDASLGGVRLVRNGDVIAQGDDILPRSLLPGDALEVPYSWIAKNSNAITVVSVTIGLVYTVFQILDMQSE